MILTRRLLLAMSGAGLLAAAHLEGAAAEFWDQKDPKDWTAEEVERLLNRSPWARQVMASSATGTLGSRSRPGMDIGGVGIGMGRRRGNPTQRSAGGKATVRWESAQPMRDAAKVALPDQFKGHYCIGVYGLDTPREDLDDLKQFATLEPKGSELAQAGIASAQIGPPSGILLGFSRDLLDISRDDKEVTFACQISQLAVRVKFNPQEMNYHGRLAL